MPDAEDQPAEGECRNPIRLLRRTIDTRSGDLTEHEIEKRCGNRRESVCPSCSCLYRGDAFQVIRSGLFDDANPNTVFTWVTLTAPGSDVFGRVHSQRRSNGRIRPCGCRLRHEDGDPLIGTPIDPNTYRYDRAADFNAHAGRLAAVTFQKLGRLLKRKLEVVRVVEYQSRGLVHVHALIRGVVTRRSLQVAITGGVNLRTQRRIAPASSGGWSWGPQCDAQVVTAATSGKLISYMIKVVGYAIKSVGDVSPSAGLHARQMERAGRRSCSCSHSDSICRAGTRLVTPQQVTTSDGTVVEVGLHPHYQGNPPVTYCRRHQAARRGWGFRGHVLTVSRQWGLTFQAVRARRQQWRTLGTVVPDHLIVQWVVLGRGTTPALPGP